MKTDELNRLAERTRERHIRASGLTPSAWALLPESMRAAWVESTKFALEDAARVAPPAPLSDMWVSMRRTLDRGVTPMASEVVDLLHAYDQLHRVAARTPVTDEQAAALVDEALRGPPNGRLRAIVRATERHHGIE